MSPKSSFILNAFLSFSLQSLALASSNIASSPRETEEISQPAERAVLMVLLHNYAHLPKQILTETEDRAGLIFRKAGVQVRWADCPLKDEDPTLYPECPVVFDGAGLFLRIFPTTATNVDHGGESLVAARIVNIFWDRVEKQSRRLNIDAPRILAHTVAHELGHLLLGSHSHSPTGIMTARWDAQRLVHICQDGLFFDAQQCELIRREIQRRKGRQTPFQSGSLAQQQSEHVD
jgi:hypothetical protein